ncbi:MAG TPA: sulfur carrier protein ThiS [Pyrinomonadaceae bacterium]|nr:sulfur carrier protein ThiS [Pyrinomonadaceae bacterium]
MEEITLNGAPRSVETSTSISVLVEGLSMPERRLAVELNGVVVRKADWPEIVLKTDDRVEIVHFVGGG